MQISSSLVSEPLNTIEYPELGVYLDCGKSDRGLTPTKVGLEVAKFADLLSGSVLNQGCGSGLQSIVAAQKDQVDLVVGIDLNPNALLLSEHNAVKNRVEAVCRFIDLEAQVREKQRFDSAVGNLPEIPGDEVFGADGSAVQRRFLQETVPRHLKAGGTLITKRVSYAADWKREAWVDDLYQVERLSAIEFARPNDVIVGPATATAEILKFNPAAELTSISCLKLVEQIEAGHTPKVIYEQMHLASLIDFLTEQSVGVLVLACTHFGVMSPVLKTHSPYEVIDFDNGLLELLKDLA